MPFKTSLVRGLVLLTAIFGAAIAEAARPTYKATSITMTDIDGYQGKLGGTITIGKASNESNITSYVLRWGLAGGCSAANSFIAEIPKTGSNLTYQLPLGTSIPGAVYEILVYTKNQDGEMLSCQSTRWRIVDKIAPTPTVSASKVRITYTADANPANLIPIRILEGIEIWPATDETNVTGYNVYWGDSEQNKLGIALAPRLAQIPATKDGKVLRYDWPSRLNMEAGAIYVLVCTENYGKEYCGKAANMEKVTDDLLGLNDTLTSVKNAVAANDESSCPGIKVMETCGNNACDGIETASNCPADCTTYGVASFNYQTLCNQVQNVYHPTSVAEIQGIVNNARTAGKHVKVVGGAGPAGTTGSASDVVCTDGVVIDMSGFDANASGQAMALETFEGKEVVNAPAGTTLHELGEWLLARGRGVGFTHLGWRDPSLAGAIGTSAHGSSPKNSNVLSQRVASMDVVGPDGVLRTYSAGTTGVTDPDLWKALTTHLGYFGVVTRVRLAVEDSKNVQVKITFHNESELFENNPSGSVYNDIKDCDYGQYNWFPSLNKYLRTCGKITTQAAETGANNKLLMPYVDFSQMSAQQTVQAYQLGSCQPESGVHQNMEKLRRDSWHLTPPLVKTVDGVERYTTDAIGPINRMTSSHLIDVGRDVFQMDWEVAVPQQNLQAAMEYVRNFTNGQNAKGRQMPVPLIGIFVRFSKVEDNTLLAYTGAGGPFADGTIVAHIEMPIFVPVALSQAQFDDYMDPYEEAMQVLVTQYGARGHWGKNQHSGDRWMFELQKQVGAYDYDNRFARFNAKVGQVDPNGMFANPFAKAIGITYPNFTYPANW